MTKIVTIRPDSTESKAITKLMKHYGLGHASKAMLKATLDIPILASQLDTMNEKYHRLMTEHQDLVDAVKEKQGADRRLTKLIEG